MQRKGHKWNGGGGSRKTRKRKKNTHYIKILKDEIIIYDFVARGGIQKYIHRVPPKNEETFRTLKALSNIISI